MTQIRKTKREKTKKIRKRKWRATNQGNKMSAKKREREGERERER